MSDMTDKAIAKMSLEEIEALLKKVIAIAEDAIKERNWWQVRADRLENYIEVEAAIAEKPYHTEH